VTAEREPAVLEWADPRGTISRPYTRESYRPYLTIVLWTGNECLGSFTEWTFAIRMPTRSEPLNRMNLCDPDTIRKIADVSDGKLFDRMMREHGGMSARRRGRFQICAMIDATTAAIRLRTALICCVCAIIYALRTR
jgi:hypothetical protein